MLACGSAPAISSSAPSITMLAARWSPSSSASCSERKREHMHVVARTIGGKLVAVVNDPSAGAHALVEFAQRRLIHRHQYIGRVTSGESMVSLESRTWQFDVPERISGP